MVEPEDLVERALWWSRRAAELTYLIEHTRTDAEAARLRCERRRAWARVDATTDAMSRPQWEAYKDRMVPAA